MEKITSEAVNRNSRLQTQFSSMCRAQAKFNDILLEFKNQLMNRVDAVQKTMMGETAECERHLSSLNSGYGSFIENSEKLCQQFGNVLNDVEKLEGNFQDALTNALRDEETQAQERQSDIKSNISCLISCNFDPLQPLLNDCGENLRNIFVYLTHWRDTLLEKLTIQEELLNDYLSTEDKNLGLLRDSCKDVTQKQKEFIQEYSELISSALSEKHERKTIFDEKINAIEEAVEEIKNFLLEKLDDDVDKSIMVFDKFRKHADGEMRNAESLLAFSESSIRSTEDFTGEMAVSSIEALDHKMQEMRESANNAMANYQNLLTNFENCVDETKASIEPMKALEKRVADDNSRRIEIPSITSNIQNFKENLTIKNKSCETLSRDHEAELKIIETNQVTAMKEAQDSFNQLHGTFKEAVSRNISCIETSDMNGFSWRENIMKDDYEEEDDCNKTLLSTEHSNPERNVLDVTFTLSEENNKEKDTGCKFCIDKDETMATQSPPIIVAKSSKFSVSKGSKQRKNTKEISHFDKVEKWFQELVGNDLDDTSSEGEKSDTTA